MVEVTNELIHEVQKAMQHDISRLRTDVREVKTDVQAVRSHVLGIQQDISNIYATLGEHAERLDGIERRLALLEPAH